MPDDQQRQMGSTVGITALTTIISAGVADLPGGALAMELNTLATSDVPAGVLRGSNRGGSVGAARRMEFEAAEYHGAVSNGVKSRGLLNGQEALNLSVQVKPTSPRRVGIDYSTGEFVVFDKTINNIYHGHVREWSDLHPDMQRALQGSGMADRRGNILGNQ